MKKEILLNKIEQFEYDESLLLSLVKCIKYVWVSGEKESSNSVIFLIECIEAFFKMSPSVNCLIFSMPYRFEEFIWLNIFLEKYIPKSRLTNQVTKSVQKLVNSSVISNLEVTIRQQILIALYLRDENKIIIYKKELLEKIECVIGCRYFIKLCIFEDLILLYMSGEDTEKYMRRLFSYFILREKFDEVWLCNIILNRESIGTQPLDIDSCKFEELFAISILGGDNND